MIRTGARRRAALRAAAILSLAVVAASCDASGNLGGPPVEPEAPRLFRISELAAVAGAPISQDSELRPDWIEIENVSDDEQPIGGWFLSDDPEVPDLWPLPELWIEAGERLIVVASQRPIDGVDEALRAPFSLKAEGEFLALVEPDGRTVHQGFPDDYPEQRYAVSYGFDEASGEYRYFSEPSPGEPHRGPTWLGFASDPTPDVPRGFYDSSFSVSLESDPDATIYVTTDGAVPTAGPDHEHTGPLPVDGTSFVRALATRPEHLPSRLVTHSYIFVDDVLAQPEAPEGFPPQWQPGVDADYGVDASVASAGELESALRSLPTLSLVMPIDDWFDPSTDPATGGIYANSETARGAAWERVVSAELFDFPHGEQAQVIAGIRIYGSASRLISRPKHNLRLIFRRELGPGRLDFPLFGDDDERESVNSLLLRGQNGDSWIHPNATQRTEALYARDQLARSLHRATGQPETLQGHVHLYINGLYWGLYNTIERIDDDSMASHFGGYEQDWDVIKSQRNPDEMAVVSGSMDAWNELQLLAAAVGAGEGELAQVEELLDLEAFFDFLLVNYYNGNRDWDDNNFLAARRRTGGDRWRFFVWDSERTMLLNGDDSTTKNFPGRATAIHHALLALPEYRERFSARAELQLGAGGALSPAGVEQEFLGWTSRIETPLLAESARWGDAHRAGEPYTVGAEWHDEVERRLESYFPQRSQTVLDQLAAQGLRRAAGGLGESGR